MNLRFARTLAVVAVAALSLPALAQSYRTYSQIGTFLEGVENDHPDIAIRHAIGTSYQGRTLWAIQITDNPGVEEDEPEFRFISTMHGDEWVGNEMCLYLIDELTDNYGTDPNITALVDNIDIWIMPLMNPDGFMVPQRYNLQGRDLNRNFPDPFTSPSNTPDGRPTEVGVIMNWSFNSSFTLGANLHGGALVVNYPYDNNPEGASVFSPSPDEDLFVYISEQYSQHNLPMWNGSWTHGITNGAAWYSIDGGMQDWAYRYMGENHVTIEMNNTKIPSASTLPTFWNENRESMLAYMATCLIGVRGIVSDADTGAPLAATVTVEGIEHSVYTDPDVGDYHRMLLPGTYDLTFTADGYDPVTVYGVLVDDGAATVLDIALPSVQPEIASPNGGETLNTGTPVDITWTGSAADQFQVQTCTNYGEVTETTDGFERSSLGSHYTTGGDQYWYIAIGTYYQPVRSARAGDIDHEETSWMTREVTGGAISFWYRVHSEANYDFFRFYVNSSLEIEDSGYGGWTYFSKSLPAGTHTLKWEYTKDDQVSSTYDTVWIDEVTLTGDATNWVDVVELSTPGQTSASWTPTEEGTDCKVRVRTVYGSGVAYSAWDESDDLFTVQAGAALVGDLDGDGDVDLADLQMLLAAYGSQTGDANYNAAADLDDTGAIDLADLQILLSHYGETMP